MSDEGKYYTPELSEFHYGFEYEQFEDYDVKGKEQEWHKWVYGEHGNDNPENITYPLCRSSILRVKHLDREDVEEFGFRFNNEVNWTTYSLEDRDVELGRKGYHVHIYTDRTSITIQYMNHEVTIFNGKIKNKSEFARILKQVGIL